MPFSDDYFDPSSSFEPYSAPVAPPVDPLAAYLASNQVSPEDRAVQQVLDPTSPMTEQERAAANHRLDYLLGYEDSPTPPPPPEPPPRGEMPDFTMQQARDEAARQGPMRWGEVLGDLVGPTRLIRHVPFVGGYFEEPGAARLGYEAMRMKGVLPWESEMSDEEQAKFYEDLRQREFDNAVKYIRQTEHTGKLKQLGQAAVTIAGGMPRYSMELGLFHKPATAVGHAAARKVAQAKGLWMPQLRQTAKEIAGRGASSKGIHARMGVEAAYKIAEKDWGVRMARKAAHVATVAGARGALSTPAAVLQRALPTPGEIQWDASGRIVDFDSRDLDGGLLNAVSRGFLEQVVETSVEFAGGPMDDMAAKVNKWAGGKIRKLPVVKAALDSIRKMNPEAARRKGAPLLENAIRYIRNDKRMQASQRITRSIMKEAADTYRINNIPSEYWEERATQIAHSLFNTTRGEEDKPFFSRVWDTMPGVWESKQPMEAAAMALGFAIFPAGQRAAGLVLGQASPGQTKQAQEVITKLRDESFQTQAKFEENIVKPLTRAIREDLMPATWWENMYYFSLDLVGKKELADAKRRKGKPPPGSLGEAFEHYLGVKNYRGLKHELQSMSDKKAEDTIRNVLEQAALFHVLKEGTQGKGDFTLAELMDAEFGPVSEEQATELNTLARDGVIQFWSTSSVDVAYTRDMEGRPVRRPVIEREALAKIKDPQLRNLVKQYVTVVSRPATNGEQVLEPMFRIPTAQWRDPESRKGLVSRLAKLSPQAARLVEAIDKALEINPDLDAINLHPDTLAQFPHERGLSRVEGAVVDDAGKIVDITLRAQSESVLEEAVHADIIQRQAKRTTAQGLQTAVEGVVEQTKDPGVRTLLQNFLMLDPNSQDANEVVTKLIVLMSGNVGQDPLQPNLKWADYPEAKVAIHIYDALVNLPEGRDALRKMVDTAVGQNAFTSAFNNNQKFVPNLFTQDKPLEAGELSPLADDKGTPAEGTPAEKPPAEGTPAESASPKGTPPPPLPNISEDTVPPDDDPEVGTGKTDAKDVIGKDDPYSAVQLPLGNQNQQETRTSATTENESPQKEVFGERRARREAMLQLEKGHDIARKFSESINKPQVMAFGKNPEFVQALRDRDSLRAFFDPQKASPYPRGSGADALFKSIQARVDDLSLAEAQNLALTGQLVTQQVVMGRVHRDGHYDTKVAPLSRQAAEMYNDVEQYITRQLDHIVQQAPRTHAALSKAWVRVPRGVQDYIAGFHRRFTQLGLYKDSPAKLAERTPELVRLIHDLTGIPEATLNSLGVIEKSIDPAWRGVPRIVRVADLLATEFTDSTVRGEPVLGLSRWVAREMQQVYKDPEYDGAAMVQTLHDRLLDALADQLPVVQFRASQSPKKSARIAEATTHSILEQIAHNGKPEEASDRPLNIRTPTRKVQQVVYFPSEFDRVMEANRMRAVAYYGTRADMTRDAFDPDGMTWDNYQDFREAEFDNQLRQNALTYNQAVGNFGDKVDSAPRMVEMPLMRWDGGRSRVEAMEALAGYKTLYENTLARLKRQNKEHEIGNMLVDPALLDAILAKDTPSRMHLFYFNDTVNKARLMHLLHGDLAQYGTGANLIKRTGVVVTPGKIPLVGIEGGLREKTSVLYVVAPQVDVEFPVLQDDGSPLTVKGQDLSDGATITMRDWSRRYAVSLGQGDRLPNGWDTTKPLYTRVEGEHRTLIKTAMFREDLAEAVPGSAHAALVKFAREQDIPIDMIAVTSAAKLRDPGVRTLEVVQRSDGSWSIQDADSHKAVTKLTPDQVGSLDSSGFRHVVDISTDPDTHPMTQPRQFPLSLAGLTGGRGVLAALDKLHTDQINDVLKTVTREALLKDPKIIERIVSRMPAYMDVVEGKRGPTMEESLFIGQTLTRALVRKTQLEWPSTTHTTSVPEGGTSLKGTHFVKFNPESGTMEQVAPGTPGARVRLSRAISNKAVGMIADEVTPGVIQNGVRTPGKLLGETEGDPFFARSSSGYALLSFAEWLSKNPRMRPDLMHGFDNPAALLEGLISMVNAEQRWSDTHDTEALLDRLDQYIRVAELDVVLNPETQLYEVHIPGEPFVYERIPNGGPNSVGIARISNMVPTANNVSYIPVPDWVRQGADFDADSLYNFHWTWGRDGRTSKDNPALFNRVIQQMMDVFAEPDNIPLMYTPVDTDAYESIPSRPYATGASRAYNHPLNRNMELQAVGKHGLGAWASGSRILADIAGRVWGRDNLKIELAPGLTLDFSKARMENLDLGLLQRDGNIILTMFADHGKLDGRVTTQLGLDETNAMMSLVLAWGMPEMTTDPVAARRKIKDFLDTPEMRKLAQASRDRKNLVTRWRKRKEKAELPKPLQSFLRVVREFSMIQRTINLQFEPPVTEAELTRAWDELQTLRIGQVLSDDGEAVKNLLDVSRLLPTPLIERSRMVLKQAQDLVSGDVVTPENTKRGQNWIRERVSQFERDQPKAIANAIQEIRQSLAQKALHNLVPEGSSPSTVVQAFPGWRKEHAGNKLIEALTLARRPDQAKEKAGELYLTIKRHVAMMDDADPRFAEIRAGFDALPEDVQNLLAAYTITETGPVFHRLTGGFYSLLGPQMLDRLTKAMVNALPEWEAEGTEADAAVTEAPKAEAPKAEALGLVRDPDTGQPLVVYRGYGAVKGSPEITSAEQTLSAPRGEGPRGAGKVYSYKGIYFITKKQEAQEYAELHAERLRATGVDAEPRVTAFHIKGGTPLRIANLQQMYPTTEKEMPEGVDVVELRWNTAKADKDAGREFIIRDFSQAVPVAEAPKAEAPAPAPGAGAAGPGSMTFNEVAGTALEIGGMLGQMNGETGQFSLVLPRRIVQRVTGPMTLTSGVIETADGQYTWLDGEPLPPHAQGAMQEYVNELKRLFLAGDAVTERLKEVAQDGMVYPYLLRDKKVPLRRVMEFGFTEAEARVVLGSDYVFKAVRDLAQAKQEPVSKLIIQGEVTTPAPVAEAQLQKPEAPARFQALARQFAPLMPDGTTIHGMADAETEMQAWVQWAQTYPKHMQEGLSTQEPGYRESAAELRAALRRRGVVVPLGKPSRAELDAEPGAAVPLRVSTSPILRDTAKRERDTRHIDALLRIAGMTDAGELRALVKTQRARADQEVDQHLAGLMLKEAEAAETMLQSLDQKTEAPDSRLPEDSAADAAADAMRTREDQVIDEALKAMNKDEPYALSRSPAMLEVKSYLPDIPGVGKIRSLFMDQMNRQEAQESGAGLVGHSIKERLGYTAGVRPDSPRAQLAVAMDKVVSVIADRVEDPGTLTLADLKTPEWADAMVYTEAAPVVVDGMQQYQMIANKEGELVGFPVFTAKDGVHISEVVERYEAARQKNPKLAPWTEVASLYRKEMQNQHKYQEPISRVPYRLNYALHQWDADKRHAAAKQVQASAKQLEALFLNEFKKRSETPPDFDPYSPKWRGKPVTLMYQRLLQDFISRSQRALAWAQGGGTDFNQEFTIPTATGRAEERIFNTYADGLRFGFVPRTLNSSEQVSDYARELSTAARNKTILSSLAVMQNQDRTPQVILMQDASNQHGDTQLESEVIYEHVENLLQWARSQPDATVELMRDIKSVDRTQNPWEQLRRIMEVGSLESRLRDAGFVDAELPQDRLGFTRVWVQQGEPHQILKHIADRGFRDMSEKEGWRGRLGSALQAINRFNSLVKQVRVTASGFFMLALDESFTSALGMRYLDPITAIKRASATRKKMMDGDPIVRDWVRAGVRISAETKHPEWRGDPLLDVLNKAGDLVGKHPAGKYVNYFTLGAIRRMHKAANHFLWDVVQPTMKIHMAETLYQEARASYPGINDAALRRDTANLVNDLLGAQNWSEYLWATPMVRDVLRATWFAPDWTLSAINAARLSEVLGSVLQVQLPTAKRHSTPFPRELLTNRYWPMFIFALLVGIPNVLQFLIYQMNKLRGEPDKDLKPFTFLNEAGRESHVDITPLFQMLGKEFPPTGQRRVYTRWGKQAFELGRWFTQPFTSALTKSSPTMQVLWEQLTSKSTGGWDMPWVSAEEYGEITTFFDTRLGALTKQGMPFSVLSFLEGRPTTFFSPTSMGMSRRRATQQLQAMFSLYAEDTFWSQIKGSPTRMQNVKKMLPQVVDGLIKNGYGPQVNQIVGQALGRARSRYNFKIAEELQKNPDAPDEKAIAENLKKLLRLEATSQTLSKSLDISMASRRATYTQEQRQAQGEAVGRAWAEVLSQRE